MCRTDWVGQKQPFEVEWPASRWRALLPRVVLSPTKEDQSVASCIHFHVDLLPNIILLTCIMTWGIKLIRVDATGHIGVYLEAEEGNLLDK